MPKVIVGMSGGVDSSVTAYLLKEQGYEVEGLSFLLWEARIRSDFTTCCSLQAMEAAAKTARHIGISYSTVDVRADFIEKVIEPFVDAYTKGITPNPCILCNRHIKFPFLLNEAEKRGADLIATGHYARVETEQSIVNSQETHDSRLITHYSLLKKGIDLKKDQSYVLYVLRQDELKRLILPLGNYKKEDVRAIAKRLVLPAAQRPESQEICFIEGKNYFKFISELSPVACMPGPIIDMNGKIIGTHRGIYGYTIGQRKGLGISTTHPLYVVKIDAVKNAIHVGPHDAAKIKEFVVDDLNWIMPWGRGEALPRPCRATVKVRSMMRDEPARIDFIDGGMVRVTFDEPQWAPAPGQSAVFYDGDRVIGGGVIIQGA